MRGMKLRFSIREILLLMAVVAVVAAWVVDRAKMRTERRKLADVQAYFDIRAKFLSDTQATVEERDRRNIKMQHQLEEKLNAMETGQIATPH
jgi:hypothetical protein